MSRIKLENTMFVVTHKTVGHKYSDTGYCYIGVSPNAYNADFHDDTYDTISYKNPFYCELTALYWMWKNVDCTNIGLCHYRRFFVNVANNEVFPVSISELDSLLEAADIIVPHVSYLKTTVKKHYEMNVKNNGLDLVCNIISKDDPSYIPYIQKVLNAKECFYCNMFYSNKRIIDRYCTWLFNILGQLEPKVNMAGWNQYEKRLYGFLAEILFNIWISHEKLSVIQYDYYKTDSFPQSIKEGMDYNVKYNTKTKLRILIWPLVKIVGNFRYIKDQ